MYKRNNRIYINENCRQIANFMRRVFRLTVDFEEEKCFQMSHLPIFTIVKHHNVDDSSKKESELEEKSRYQQMLVNARIDTTLLSNTWLSWSLTESKKCLEQFHSGF